MRLIDAEALQRVLEEDSALMAQRAKTTDVGFLAVGAGITLAIAAIDAAPTVEAVPVVRCKDCRKMRREHGYLWCLFHDCQVLGDEFCSIGARMGAQRKDGATTCATLASLNAMIFGSSSPVATSIR